MSAIQTKTRRGGAAQNVFSFIGALGEIIYNTDTGLLHIHDGSTAGGRVVAGNACLYKTTNATANGYQAGSPGDLCVCLGVTPPIVQVKVTGVNTNTGWQ